MPDNKPLQAIKNCARECGPLLLVLLVAAFACALHVAWSLPEIYEEAMPVRIAQKFWNWKGVGVQFHPGFFTYPAFIFYVNFLAEGFVYAIGRITGGYSSFAAFQSANSNNMAPFVLLGRWITILFSLGTIVLAYLIGRKIGGKNGGLLAAIVLAMSPLLISEAHLVNVDSPVMFFAMLTLWYALRILGSGELSAYICAGIAAGLATASKYNGALAFALPVAAHIMREGDAPSALRSLLRPRLWLMLGAGVFIFCLTNPYIVLDFSTFWSQFADVQIHMDEGHLGLNPGESGYAYYLFTALPAALGWAGMLGGVVAFGFAMARRGKTDVLLWLLPLLMLGVMGGWKMHAERYFLPAIPFIAVAAAAILTELWQKLGGQHAEGEAAGPAMNPKLKAALGVLGVVMLIALPAKEIYAYHLSFSLPDTRSVAREWIANNIDPKNFIVVAPNGPNLPEAQNVLRLPFNALETERTAAFYDMRWFGDAKLFIVSDYDQGRYTSDPARYKEFLDFYAKVRERAAPMMSAVPDEYRRGPAITVYVAYKDSTNDEFPDDLIQRLAGVGNDEEVFLFCRRLGSVMSEFHKIGKAYPLLQIAVAIRPDDLPARQMLSRVLCLAAKWDDAHANMREYLAAHPDNALAILYDGDIYANEGKMKDAETTYLEGLTLDSLSIQAYQKLGALYFHDRDASKLKPLLLRYQAILDPKSPDAQIVSRQLADLATWKTTK